MKSDNLTKIAGLSLAALLALTACGDDDNGNGADEANSGDEQVEGEEGEAGGETFAFEDTSAGPYDEVTVTVPDEYHDEPAILEQEEDVVTEEHSYSETEAIESITLRAAEPEESQCAIEAEYVFTGAAEDPTDQDIRSASASGPEDPDDPDGWLDEYDIVEEIGDHHFVYNRPDHEIYDDLIGEDLNIDEDDEQFLETHSLVEEVDCNSPVTFTITAAHQDEYDGTEDYPEGILSDDEIADFEGITWASLRTSSFATFDVAVDANGELSIQNAEVSPAEAP